MFSVDLIILSAREGHLIDHRLAAPDSIADALADLYDRDLVLDSIDYLLRLTRNHVIPTASLGEVDAAVLANCIEGSTWVAAAFAAASDESNPNIRSIATRTITGLAQKFRDAGIAIEAIPIQ